MLTGSPEPSPLQQLDGPLAAVKRAEINSRQCSPGSGTRSAVATKSN